LEIRLAEKKDIRGILNLLGQVNLVHHELRPDLFKVGTKYDAAQLEEMIGIPEDPIFICPGGDGEVMGYPFCRSEEVEESPLRTGIRTLYIDDLCVNESAGGKGVGPALYEHALSFARERGFYNVTLHVWGGNGAAERFYRKMGMRDQYICMEQVL
jgi:ribosomal protein S18 acetylase RimI-like enzyme